MTLIIFLIIFVILAAIQVSIPFLVKRTVIFGVSIPDRYIKDEMLTSYKRKYLSSMLFISAALLVLYLLWAILSQPLEEHIVLFGMAIQLGILFISMTLYFHFHAKTSKRKKEQQWGENLKPVQMTDLLVRSKDEMLPWYLFALPMVITIGLIVYTAMQYHIMPEQIPTHWGPNGKADAFTTKNPFSVHLNLIMLLILQILFLGTNEATKRSGIKLSATNTNASRIRQLTLRKYSSWLTFVVSVLITALFSFFQLTTIHEGLVDDAVLFAVPLIFLLVTLIGTIFFSVRVGTAGAHIENNAAGEIVDLDEDQYWKGGLFYFNKNDPSIFVEKRFGVGWTLNFANPKGYLIIIVPIAVIILVSFLS